MHGHHHQKMVMPYNKGPPQQPSGRYAIGTVLPLSGEPFEVNIPKGCQKKEELKEYLSTLEVFKTKDDYEYHEKIELGFYWRNIMTDYKKTPRTCLIFRFSKGTVLPENHLCQFWRADPWKKTYGPIIILRIQDGNTQFRYEDYRLTDYHRQCFYNLQQQQQYFNPASKNYVGNQPPNPEQSTPAPQGAYGQGQRPAYGASGATGQTPSYTPGRYGAATQGQTGYTGTTAPTTTTPTTSQYPYPTGQYGQPSPPATAQSTYARPDPYSKQPYGAPAPQAGGFQTPFSNMVIRDVMDMERFQTMVIELQEICEFERWDYVDDKTSYTFPVLFHYLYFHIVKANQSPKAEEVCVLGDRMLFHTGLKKRKSDLDLFVILEKNTSAQGTIRLIVEKFVTWYDAIRKEGFHRFRKPTPIQFFGAEEHFKPSLFVDFNFTGLYQQYPTFFPQKWQQLDPYQLRLLFTGASIFMRKRITQDPRFVVKSIFQNGETQTLGVQYLVPFQISESSHQMVSGGSDDEKNEVYVDFVIAVREMKQENGTYYMGTTVLSADWSYCSARTIERPLQRWLYVYQDNKKDIQEQVPPSIGQDREARPPLEEGEQPPAVDLQQQQQPSEQQELIQEPIQDMPAFENGDLQ